MTSTRKHFSSLLLSLPEATSGGPISLALLAQVLGNRSTGALLLFLALPMVLPIPAPGISVVFGVPLTLISAQLLFGRQTLWLPRQLANRSISREQLEAYIKRATPAVHKMEKLVKPRLVPLTRGIALRIVGTMCLVLALIITLPVPLGHLVPGTAISVMALGLIERDGLMILAGLLIGGLALLVVIFAMIGLAAAGHNLLS
ncbi:MAG TPA: exopolysaccharide biosynthesis protein [Rhodocyclaceae bacterium]|nr:exopolysaccharide biosynthesis protein [Rhodocyclaceae bacterium]